MKTKTKIIIIGLIVLLLFFISQTWVLWEASYLSYSLGCFVDDPLATGIVAGSYNESSGQLSVYVPKEDPSYLGVLKHEECHQFIAKMRMSSSCYNPLARMSEEFICYSVQYYYQTKDI